MRLRLALSSLMAGLLLHRSCSLLTRIQVSSSRRRLSGLKDRISSQGVSLDVNLIASQPQLVISHLKWANYLFFDFFIDYLLFR